MRAFAKQFRDLESCASQAQCHLQTPQSKGQPRQAAQQARRFSSLAPTVAVVAAGDDVLIACPHKRHALHGSRVAVAAEHASHPVLDCRLLSLLLPLLLLFLLLLALWRRRRCRLPARPRPLQKLLLLLLIMLSLAAAGVRCCAAGACCCLVPPPPRCLPLLLAAAAAAAW